jgi:hypothetical protein
LALFVVGYISNNLLCKRQGAGRKPLDASQVGSMRFYKIHVNHKFSGYDVFYKTDMHYSNVAKQAVIDGDLIDVDLPYVDKVEVITPEHYYEFMYD